MNHIDSTLHTRPPRIAGEGLLQQPEPSAAQSRILRSLRHPCLIASILLAATVALGGANRLEAAEPSGRIWHAFASNGFSTVSQSRLYLFGGDNGAEALNDLWFYRVGPGWTEVTFPRRAKKPSPRAHAGFSCGDGQCLVVGGGWGTSKTESWIFTEATGSWSKLNCKRRNTCPSGRYGATAAYDPLVRQHVLFGGISDTSLDDTHVLRSGSWVSYNPFTRPSPRSFAAAAFVPSQGTISVNRVVLFGGQAQGHNLCDMWAWTGTDWVAISAQNQGPCLSMHSMAWESKSGQSPRLIVTGGFVDNNNTPNTTTWYFTFSSSTSGSWSSGSLACGSSGPAWPESRMALDIPSQKKVFFGGAVQIGGEIFLNNETTVCD